MGKKIIRKALSNINPPVWGKYYHDIQSLVTKQQIISFQQTYLKRLLIHAYRNVPYYNHILGEVGVIANDEVDLTKFNNIPILKKEIIRNNLERLTSNDIANRRWYYNSSGGSTGEPIKLIQDNMYRQWGRATSYYYYYKIIGIDEFYAKKVILWGSERDLYQRTALPTKIIRWLNDSVFLNSYKMTQDDLHRYVRIINSYKPELIRGYAESLYELCNFVEKNGLQIYRPKFIVSSAEVMTDEKRAKIERVFDKKVYDFYGAREVNNLAGECKNGLLHTFNFYNYIEVLDSFNHQVNEGEEGKIVVTNLHNYSMPLIRYEIGDLAVLGPDNCHCGIALSTLKSVTGRIGENFITKNGTIISASALTIIFNFKEWVRKFQIIQEDYETVKILVVLQSELKPVDINEIDNKLKFLLGQNCKVRWDFVEEIPKTRQGKHIYIKSLVPH